MKRIRLIDHRLVGKNFVTNRFLACIQYTLGKMVLLTSVRSYIRSGEERVTTFFVILQSGLSQGVNILLRSAK